MQTNFFQQLSGLNNEGDWAISIKTAAQNRMLVSILFTSDKSSDPARKMIPPLVLKGTAAEMDEGFFKSISTPIQKTVELLTNMEAFEKAHEEAKKESKMEQEKQDKAKKQKETQQKKFQTAMEKVEELEEAGKFREAAGQLPKADDFPDHAEEITEKKKDLTAKFEQPGLFENIQ